MNKFWRNTILLVIWTAVTALLTFVFEMIGFTNTGSMFLFSVVSWLIMFVFLNILTFFGFADAIQKQFGILGTFITVALVIILALVVVISITGAVTSSFMTTLIIFIIYWLLSFFTNGLS